MARVSKENKVVVTVYTESQEPRPAVNPKTQPPNKALVTNQWKQHIANNNNNRGYNRRTELLKYSQRLRKSTRSPASSPYPRPPDPISPFKNKQPIARSMAINLVCSSFSLVNLCGKSKGEKTTTSCFGNLIQRSYKALTSFQSKKDTKKQNQRSGYSTKNNNNVKDNVKSTTELSTSNRADHTRIRRIRLLNFTCT